MIAGDFNMNPASLLATGLPAILGATIYAPPWPTCGSNTFDYFLVCDELRHAVLGVQRIRDATVHPHWASRLTLSGAVRRKLVRQVIRPRNIAGGTYFGPHAAHVPTDHLVGSAGSAPSSASANDAITWLADARNELGGTLEASTRATVALTTSCGGLPRATRRIPTLVLQRCLFIGG